MIPITLRVRRGLKPNPNGLQGCNFGFLVPSRFVETQKVESFVLSLFLTPESATFTLRLGKRPSSVDKAILSVHISQHLIKVAIHHSHRPSQGFVKVTRPAVPNTMALVEQACTDSSPRKHQLLVPRSGPRDRPVPLAHVGGQSHLVIFFDVQLARSWNDCQVMQA
jgi:hypothetical protein